MNGEYPELWLVWRGRWKPGGIILECAIYFQPTIQNPIQHESESPLDMSNQNLQKKETSSFGNEPPWLVLPMQQPITLWDSCISSLLSACPTDACLAAPVDRWILQVTSQHREACWDTWLFFCASRLPKFAFITHQKGSERKKGVQCGAVVDCGSSEGGKSSQGLEKQLSGLLSTRVQQFTEVRRKKRVSVSGKERKSLLHSKT